MKIRCPKCLHEFDTSEDIPLGVAPRPKIPRHVIAQVIRRLGKVAASLPQTSPCADGCCGRKKEEEEER